jgi:hypothetical protein
MNNKNIRITLMMYPSRPAEYAVINELKNPRHRAARIRKLLIFGLDKVPVADDFNAIEDVNQSPFRVSVTLFHDSAEDLRVISAYERIPRQRRQDWIRQRLVSGLASSGTYIPATSTPTAPIQPLYPNAISPETLPVVPPAIVKKTDLEPNMVQMAELDVDLDKLEQPENIPTESDMKLDENDRSAFAGLFR